jgi:hypothetical protein
MRRSHASRQLPTDSGPRSPRPKPDRQNGSEKRVRDAGPKLDPKEGSKPDQSPSRDWPTQVWSPAWTGQSLDWPQRFTKPNQGFRGPSSPTTAQGALSNRPALSMADQASWAISRPSVRPPAEAAGRRISRPSHGGPSPVPGGPNSGLGRLRSGLAGTIPAGLHEGELQRPARSSLIRLPLIRPAKTRPVKTRSAKTRSAKTLASKTLAATARTARTR